MVYRNWKCVGTYTRKHLYGLPKIHKSVTDPPLRPIISMSGTVTNDVAQSLNFLIRPFLHSSHMVKSSDEFLLCIRNTTLSDEQKIVSLDVTSLFTNDPIDRTIYIILESTYSHGTLP